MRFSGAGEGGERALTMQAGIATSMPLTTSAYTAAAALTRSRGDLQ